MSAIMRSRRLWIPVILAFVTGSLLVGLQSVRGSAARTAGQVSGVTDQRAASYAGKKRVFGLVKPGPSADEIQFAPARRKQPGGPETLRPELTGGYEPLSLAPGARINVTAPIAKDGVEDWIRGIRVSPEEFHALFLAEERRGPMFERAQMFELWFDGQGRVIRMRHYFTP